MEIRELIIQHYGKFKNNRMILKPGINIIYGGNGAGKSTIHSFIRSMLFGMEESDENPHTHDWRPWEEQEDCRGCMRVEEQGVFYRIEREFRQGAGTLRVVRESDGVEYERPEQMMEALLGGIDEYGFSHTVFLSQGSQQEDVRGLSALLRSHPSAGTDQLDPEAAAALKKLQERSYYFEEKQKKQEQTPEQPRSDTTDADSRKAAGHVRQPKAGEHAKQSTSSDPMIQRGRILLQGLLLFSALLALLGALLMSEMRIRIFLGIFAAVFLLSIVPVRYLLQEEELPDEQPESGRRQGRQRMQNGQNLRQTIPKFLQADTAQSTDAAQPEGAALELAALTMAMEHIRQVGTGRTRGGEQETEKRASEILCALTGGRYDRMRFGRDGRIELYTGDQSIDLQQAGRATAQQAGFAMRMAIGEYLAGGRELPVILDEAFSMYDEPHLEEALRWLKSSGRQVILFTCQRREREILRRIEQNYLGRRTV